MRPTFLYGTAWKEDATERCVGDALAAGFRAIDTANQRKHYYEEGVGRALSRSGVPREALFLQTKFTFRGGQDHRLPYDDDASVATQVRQSFERSLVHLGTTYLDSLVLHGPSRGDGLGPEDHAAWQAMEALVDEGRVRVLGISNVNAGQLHLLLESARLRPTYVQNRCYARTGWDSLVRGLCDRHGITYQGFSLLTANRQVLGKPELAAIASRHGRTPAQVVFRFCQQIGMLPLTGTQDPRHMREDLDLAFDLDESERATIEALG